MSQDKPADKTAEFEPTPHPSGVSFIKISLWADGDVPGDGDPHESFGGHVHDDETYALGGGEVGTVKEQMMQFLESHLDGECDCLDEVKDGQ